MTAEVIVVPVLQDNYSYILLSGKKAAVVDPGDPLPVIHELERLNVKPVFILNTHHHADHIAGNAQLKKKYGAVIIGPESEKNRIPDLDKTVKESEMLKIGQSLFEVIETPGHTSGHVCFYSGADKILFCGDTLFSMGCGKLFEGTAAQMWESLSRLAALPDDTKVYCGHEYTQSNGQFCQRVEPDNADIKKRLEEVKKLRANGLPTLPTTIEAEKQTNVFLRSGSAQAFTELRRLKDRL